ncbi:hypothetical protein AHAS_Ahas18G0191000 [Arachis hypogaea]
MLGNSYPNAGGPLSQSHVMDMLNDVNSSDNSRFDMNDFPQLTSRPSSAGGPQAQLGANEDFQLCQDSKLPYDLLFKESLLTELSCRLNYALSLMKSFMDLRAYLP